MASEDKCFTFIWKLENVSYCIEKNDEEIRSPDFVVDLKGETKWFIKLYLRGVKEDEMYIGAYLFRSAECKGQAKVSIKFELTFVSEDSSVSTPSITYERLFQKNTGDGSCQFIKREVFNIKRSAYLPLDTLTVCCKIWRVFGKMKENIRCIARTRIGVQKKSFLWHIKNFSTLEIGQKYSYQIKSLDHDKILMSVNLCLSEGLGSDEMMICFRMNLEDHDIKFSTLLLSLVDVSENMIECNRDEFWFGDESESKEFKFFFTKNKLMAMKSSYLPDDILSLHWECAFSKGIVSKEIEEVQVAKTSFAKKFSNPQDLNKQKMLPLLYPLNDNLKSLYDKNFLCDVKLKTSTSEFKAHKVVLSASSSVFEAMFSNDMKEKVSNCINIEDLSDDTIGRMLAYIYTARIEDLTWEVASQLYAAADKYAIFSLKNICASYIKDNLSPINACDVLLLSDLHADDDLKSSVQDYMLKHLREIINSDGWKLLMQTNPTLAAETLSLPYK